MNSGVIFYWRHVALGCSVAAALGCTGVVDGYDDDADESPGSESVATDEEAAVLNQYAVGLVPAGAGGREGGLYADSCPSSTLLQSLSIVMDDEDDENATQWGWSWRLLRDTNPDLRGGHFNTRMTFCKADGRKFWPLTRDPSDKIRFYAVLKLGQYCPNGSIEMSRYIDNEDDDPANSYSGPIAPNVSDRNTTLKFCFFMSGPTIMSYFPAIGVPYAVYHDFEGSQPVQFVSKAKHYSDDEDYHNENSSPSGTTASGYFREIISDGPNTYFDLAIVDAI